MIKNRLTILISLCVIVSSLTIGLVTASEIHPSVIISDYSIYPEVLMPRDYGTLAITITNTAQDTLITKEDKDAWIIPTRTIKRAERKSAPINAEIRRIHLHSNEIEVITGTYRDISDLGPMQSITLPFKIQAPVKTGIYIVEVRIEMDDGTDIRHPISVVVDDRTVALSADLPLIAPMKPTAFNIEIGNQRPNNINGVNIIAMINKEYLQIAPKSTFIGTMGAGEIQTINFELFHHTPCVFFEEIPFKLEFWNGINRHTEYISFPIEFIERSSVSLSVIDYPTIVRQGDVANIEFDVMNERIQNVTSAEIIPINNNKFQMTPSSILVGNIKSGEIIATRPEMEVHAIMDGVLEEEIRLNRMIFNLDTKNLPIGEHEIDFIVVYRDKDGRIFESEPLSVVLTVIEPIPIIPIGIGVAILILLIGLGYAVYKKMNDKKSNDDGEIEDFLDDE